MPNKTQQEFIEEFVNALLPEHNNIKPDDAFNKGYLRAIDVVKAKAGSVISQAISFGREEREGEILKICEEIKLEKEVFYAQEPNVRSIHRIEEKIDANKIKEK